MKGTKYIETMVQLATTAFGLVAALAWNEAITSLFRDIFGSAGSTIGRFVYAIFITVLVVMVTTRLAKLNERVEKSNKPS